MFSFVRCRRAITVQSEKKHNSTSSFWYRVDPRVDGRMILKLILQKWDGGGHRLDRSGSRLENVTGSRECGHEPSGSIKCGEFLEKLRAC
jgi:hypothetical protein